MIAESAWRHLGHDLTGRIWRPGEPDYLTRSSLFNKRYAGVRPAGVVSVATVDDVRRAIGWARDNGLPIAVRSSGHSYAGHSVNDGLVIDLSGLREVSADGSTGRVVLGGGATMADLYRRLEPHQMAFPAGNSPAVGIGGLTLGGGVAVTSRAWGLTCDALVATTLVTADGEVLTCDATEHPDLFWACRGAGGGQLGVNVSFTFQARPVRDVSVCVLVWDDADPVRLLTVLQEIVRQAPDEFSARLGISTDGVNPDQARKNLVVTAVGQFLGPAEQLRQIMDPALVAATPARQRLVDLSYWQGKDYLQHDTSAASFAVRTRVAGRPLPAGALADLLSWLQRWPGSHNTDGAGIGLFAWGGAINRVPVTATAFPHRDALFLVSMDTSWTGADPADQVRANLDWLTGLYETMGEHLPDSAYQNFTDPDLRDWRTAYYGPNYPRLAEIKRAYDPADIFSTAQHILP